MKWECSENEKGKEKANDGTIWEKQKDNTDIVT